MKRVCLFRHPFLFITTFSIVITLLGCTPIRHTRSETIGSWFGFEEGMGGFVRIEFDEDGTGYIARASVVDSPPDLYFIERWTLNKHDIDIAIRPIGKDTPHMTIYKVSWKGSKIYFEYGDPKLKWRPTALLISEQYFESQNNKVKSKIDEYRKEKDQERVEGTPTTAQGVLGSERI